MTDIKSHDPGMAERTTEDFTKGTIYAGSAERLLEFGVAAVALATNSVIAKDGTGGLVLATDVAAGEAIGLTTHAAAIGDSVNYFITGDYFMDALVWDASLDTDAKRKAAFVGSPSPTQITLQKAPGAAAL